MIVQCGVLYNKHYFINTVNPTSKLACIITMCVEDQSVINTINKCCLIQLLIDIRSLITLTRKLELHHLFLASNAGNLPGRLQPGTN